MESDCIVSEYYLSVPIGRSVNICRISDQGEVSICDTASVCVTLCKSEPKSKKVRIFSELFYFGIISISAWLSLSCANSVVFEEQR